MRGELYPHLQKPVESEWISVDDRLPENNNPVLLYQKKDMQV